MNLFYAHFNAKTPPQNAPFLALLQRNAKAQSANYANINALHFCILQFTFLTLVRHGVKSTFQLSNKS